LKPQRRWPWYHEPLAELIAGVLLPVFHGLVGYGSKIENWLVVAISYGFFLILLVIVFRYYSSVRQLVNLRRRIIFFVIVPNVLALFAGWYWVENFDIARLLIGAMCLSLIYGLFFTL
jgi:hypothetical protein